MRSTVITGVSRGLGAALFEEVYRRGDRVLALGRRFTDEQRHLATTSPQRVRLRIVDLAEPGGLPDAAELRDFLDAGTDETVEAVLIHNAALVGPIGALGALDPGELAASLTVNLTAPAVLTNAFLTAVPAGPRRILYVSSKAAHQVVDGWPAYCASKAGAEMFFRVLAQQCADDPSVLVACVDPGQMATGMQEEIRQAGRSGVHFPRWRDWQDSFEQGRLRPPEQVASQILATFLDRPLDSVRPARP